MSEDVPRAEASRSARGSRASGCLAFVLMLGALPTLIIGVVIYTSAAKSAAANSGVGGGLAGLGEVAGIGAMVLGALTFVVGAVVFARTAKE